MKAFENEALEAVYQLYAENEDELNATMDVVTRIELYESGKALPANVACMESYSTAYIKAGQRIAKCKFSEMLESFVTRYNEER